MNYPIYTASRFKLFCISPYVSFHLFPDYSIIYNNKSEISLKININCNKIKNIISFFDQPSSLDIFFESNNTLEDKEIISQLINYGVIE